VVRRKVIFRVIIISHPDLYILGERFRHSYGKAPIPTSSSQAVSNFSNACALIVLISYR
jgi:hypothetical protein